ncbi:hypothetical protein RRF57_004664 [Xylaria bambusicola]|uniref:Uncharacterized protein n=1 Tax=Xylaria bambusicola TaxID=326684 RepID=A0AAN7UNI6_9PEZI
MSAPMIINGILATTLLATREMLFQLSLNAIWQTRFETMSHINILMPKILKLIRWLLESGQSADTPVRLVGPGPQATPLQISAIARSQTLLADLLKHGATTINIAGRWRMPPLFEAAGAANHLDNLSVLDFLFASGATIDYNQTTIKYCFVSKDTFRTIVVGKKEHEIALNIMKMTFARFAGIIDFSEEAKEFNAADVVISAASSGNIRILKFLYDNNFNLTRANPFGVTALHAAASGGYAECCELLLEYGVDANHNSSALPSPIHLACYRNKIEVVKLLHGRGACIDWKFCL